MSSVAWSRSASTSSIAGVVSIRGLPSVWRLRSVVVQQVAGCVDLGDRVGVPMDDRPPAVFAAEQVGHPQDNLAGCPVLEHGHVASLNADCVAEVAAAAGGVGLIVDLAGAEPGGRPIQSGAHPLPALLVFAVATEDRDVVRVGPMALERFRISVDQRPGSLGELSDHLEQTVAGHRQTSQVVQLRLRKPYSTLYYVTSDPTYPGPTSPMIGAQLRAAAEAVHQAVYDRLAQAGHHHLRPSHLALLKFPGPHGARPTELAARVGLRKQALNPLLNDLEELGYLQRTSDDEDRRGRILWLTPRGMSLMRIMRETLEEVESQLSDRLGAAGLRDLHLTLGLVGEIAREVAGSPEAMSS